MKALKIGWAVSLITLVTVIMGCQQEKDPVKNYPKVTSTANQKYTGAVPAVVTPPPRPPDPDNSQTVCLEPFKVSVNPDRGSKLMTFSEDVEGSYEIKVRSFLGERFSVDTVNLAPALSADLHSGRAHFSLVKQDHNVATYKFTWKPAKLRSPQVDIQAITLRYTSDFARNCGQDISEQLNLLVLPKQSADLQTPPAPVADSKPAADIKSKTVDQGAKK